MSRRKSRISSKTKSKKRNLAKDFLQASFGDSKQIKTDHKKCGIIING